MGWDGVDEGRLDEVLEAAGDWPLVPATGLDVDWVLAIYKFKTEHNTLSAFTLLLWPFSKPRLRLWIRLEAQFSRLNP